MAVTMREVAEHAGVSVSTASRALGGSTSISEETRTRVMSAASDLGYRVNRAARSLRSRESRLIGLVLNNLLNASFHTIAQVVQRRLAAEGYQLILCTTDADVTTERNLLETLADHGVDGVLVIGSGQNAEITNALQASGTAVVNVIRSSRRSTSPTVLAADRDGSYEATRFLLELGHRSIGFIGGPDTADSGRERLRGYRDALESEGLELDESLVLRGTFTPEFGTAAVDQLLSGPHRITALLSANHEATFGVLPALVARGVHIPDDLSLVCYEDMPVLQMWQPPVTVVDNGAQAIADLAVNLLLDQLRRRDPAQRDTRTYRVGAELLLRSSCAPPRP
ncbi:LacI family DNA-binding transcriptional regulator [Kineosporia babensis]|uniref:LacI family transcriptional regulator n=1 Tax=Kineosporia babensis TaxID=499548 RepID=A0A9X1NAX6_9ACTN|nr:LacI family DNA-binding transcriptional regulator [Kineosporia babensis]MCD5310745.1 LacI family transcriptional regulator [Kineosporia babensis]